ncbi:MAG TPA: diadenylate cyclase CdaA [Candidatus Saccharimonadales bacterium]|jgi:diadenylate cyclase|nr:diadenylate cyclase CdaA [Candidatus Saccharimonadales bacterium]
MIAVVLPVASLARLNLRAALDILIIAVFIYFLLKLLRGTRAVQMLVGIALLFAFYRGAQWARLEMVEWLLTTLLPYIAIALIILFQPEIRRALSRVGRNLSMISFASRNPKGTYDDIVMAAEYFSQNRIGALVVVERQAGLRTYIESGIPLDAKLSYDLLLSIFRPGSPLHDGAVIVEGSRVAAAGCFLPLSLNPMISKQLGTRHRAAIGITEDSDCLVVLVSEETGSISVASAGTIDTNLSPEDLSDRLREMVSRRRTTMVLPAAVSQARTTVRR